MTALLRRLALASIAILFLLGGTAAAFAQTTQALSLQTPVAQPGVVTNLGTQTYIVSGGQVVGAAILGDALNPGATLVYSFTATQSGLSAQGTASISLAGTTVIEGSDVPVTVSGTFIINSEVSGDVIGSSALPFFFVTAPSNVQVTVGGSTQTISESLDIESPYLNPGGLPIVIASADNYIVIAATYTQGTILWAGTQVSALVSGSLGTRTATNPASNFNLIGGEIENLVTGTAIDAGTIAFSSMTPSSLDVSGPYAGASSIPANPTMPAGQPSPYDCSAALLLPEGTCTLTGFQSTGSFIAGELSGTYDTAWTIPALYFGSTIAGSLPASAGTYSVNGRLNSGGSLCTGNGGTWTAPTETCTIPSGTVWDVAASNTLSIDTGVTLINGGTIVNSGSVLNSGTITNNGAITNEGATFYNGNSGPTGTLTNNGILTNEAGLTFNNFGSFTNSASGTVLNYGTYMNHTGGSTANSGTFFNYGTTDTHVDSFDNYGTFADMGSSNISNQGGSTLTDECAGQILNVPSHDYTQSSGCSA
jgi:fibronectin-binding autotransporter adhesin